MLFTADVCAATIGQEFCPHLDTVRKRMKRIIIHIGRPKTGSTALQAFFLENRDQLRELGVYYPLARPHSTPFWIEGQTDYGAEIRNIIHHHKLAARKRDTTTVAKAEAELLDSWSVIRAGFEATTCDSILISNEWLVGLDPNLLAPLFADYQVTVVCYLRRQDEIVQSAYIQHVRDPSIRFTGTIHTLLERPSFIKRFDYQATLMNWGKAVGLDNMVVRVYDQKNLADGIALDFFKAVGITFSEAPQKPERTANPSINQRAVVLLRFLNRFPMPRKMHKLTQQSITRLFARSLHQPHVMLNAEEKRQLMEHFEESNQAIARLYLGREDGVLFPDL